MEPAFAFQAGRDLPAHFNWQRTTALSILIGAVLTLLLGAIALIPFNGWVWKFYGFEGGHDDEMKMFDFLLFVEWPALIVLGALLGNLFYKKYVVKRLSKR